ncbi:MAG: outer membrane beta-barrel protein [bacterium]
MKKYILILILLPLFAKSQSIQQSVYLAPNSSYYSSSNTEAYPNGGMKPINYWNFGTAVGYKIEYYLPKIFSLGTSVEYLLTRAELYTHGLGPYTADRTVAIRNLIATNNIDIPLYLKIRTNSKENRFTYIRGGIGLSWMFNAHRKVEEETNFDMHYFKNPIRKKIADESFVLKNENNTQFGTFFQIGIGHSFQLKKINLSAELSYRQDLNYWIYKTLDTPILGIQEFPIKRHSISLNLGSSF